jgi:protein-disulfide isomerase
MSQASDSSWIASRLRRWLGVAALLVLAAAMVSAQQAASPATPPGGPGPATPPTPLTIVEFFDFACPFSAQAAPELKSLLESYPGKVQLVVKNLPLPSHPGAPLAHAAALAAKQQGKFWEMYNLLLRNQDKLERADLVEYAGQLGMDVDRFSADLESPSIREAIADDVAEAAGLGVDATPTFFVRGQRLIGADSVSAFKDLLEAILSGKADPSVGPTAAPRAAARAVPAIHIDDSPVRGAKDAPVTIVEFSDFQCPFCAQETSVLQSLLEEYPGQIRWVFKHFPLDSIHPASPLAHRAAMAAAQQGKFWEMHDRLFGTQRDASRDALLRSALQLGLDLPRFEKDLVDDTLQAAIDRDRHEGTDLGVDGTPSFWINGKLLVGAQPKSVFEQVLKDQFQLLPSSADSGGTPSESKASDAAPKTQSDELTLVWFSDLESPLTPPAYALLHQAMDLYPGKIRLVFKNAPLTFHGEALLAHEALLAAGAQGKFWPMHDLLLANQNALGREDLLRYASQLGLDSGKFQSELDGKTYEAAVKADLEEARVREVRGAPTFFINGVRVDGLVLFPRLQEILEAEFHRALAGDNHSTGVADAR